MENTKKRSFIHSSNFKVLIVFFLIVLVCIFALIYNKSNRFWLSKEVVNLEKELSAEETIRLYFYYLNRGDDSISNILDDGNSENGGWSYSVGLFEDAYIVDIKELSTENRPNELDAYEVKSFNTGAKGFEPLSAVGKFYFYCSLYFSIAIARRWFLKAFNNFMLLLLIIIL